MSRENVRIIVRNELIAFVSPILLLVPSKLQVVARHSSTTVSFSADENGETYLANIGVLAQSIVNIMPLVRLLSSAELHILPCTMDLAQPRDMLKPTLLMDDNKV